MNLASLWDHEVRKPSRRLRFSSNSCDVKQLGIAPEMALKTAVSQTGSAAYMPRQFPRQHPFFGLSQLCAVTCFKPDFDRKKPWGESSKTASGWCLRKRSVYTCSMASYASPNFTFVALFLRG